MYNENLHFHLIGIGGSGMSGIAEILVRQGYQVSGSDLEINAACELLSTQGVSITRGHDASHLPQSASLVVYSSAVPATNPEIVEAKRRGLPVVRRAEVLAELMRLRFGVAVAGSHGKTSTTSMTGWLLESGGLDPTVIIGGRVRTKTSGGTLGNGKYLVAETDESDKSFLLLHPSIAVVTNIDKEHVSAYGSFGELVESFRTFVHSVPFYGLAVLCHDDRRLAALADDYGRRKVTFGLGLGADLRATEIRMEGGRSSFVVRWRNEPIFTTSIPLPGEHFVSNSLAAIAVAREFGMADAEIAESLQAFPGVQRRMETTFTNSDVTVVNDYGHHPTEIVATLKAIQKGLITAGARLHVVFQPHRYSRTEECYDRFLQAFRDCDQLYIADIHPAGEAPRPGVHSERLAADIEHPHVRYLGPVENALNIVPKEASPGDVVLCLGAGSIGKIAGQLLDEFNQAVSNSRSLTSASAS